MFRLFPVFSKSFKDLSAEIVSTRSAPAILVMALVALRTPKIGNVIQLRVNWLRNTIKELIMKKLIVSACMLMSINAFAIDLSNTLVADPAQDAQEITAAIGGRGAYLLSPVTCKQTGSPADLLLNCGVQRRIAYPDGNIQDENFGCMIEYSINANGQDYTRTAWECPIL